MGSNDNKVYCLNAATGDWVWEYTTGNYVVSSPAVTGEYVYVGSYDGKVYCLNAATGEKVWEYTTGNYVASSPAVTGGYVYVGSADGKVYCLNAATGDWVWEYTTGNYVVSSPAVSGGYVYVGSNDNKVYCLNAATGLAVWDSPYETEGVVSSAPAVSGGYVYVGSHDGNVYCLNAATGDWVWEYETGDWVRSSPAVTGGYVYVGSDDNNTYCLNAATGDWVWEYTTGNYVVSSPAVSGGYVYVGSYDGNVYCLNAADGDIGSWPMFKNNNARTGDPSISDLTTHYYLYILGRTPDPGGLTFWTNEIIRLESLGVDIKEGFISLAKTFFNSQEYLDSGWDDGEYVTDLYNTFFDREPDPGGWEHWTNELDQGVSRNLILNYFVFSDEFNDYMEQIFGVSQTRPENNMVNDYYRGLLSRIAENEGFNYWLGRFQDEQCDGSAESIRALALEIASYFINSQEYTNRSRDDLEYIEDLYDAFMRRRGDSNGVDFFLTELDNGGYTRGELLNVFVSEYEFQDRVQNIIDAGCYE